MRNGVGILYVLRDNMALVALGVVVLMLLVAWLVFEALRGHGRGNEVSRLRSRLYQLERGQAVNASFGGGPAVLPNRWISVGGAATTSDGGCLVLVEAASPLQRTAMMTVRVDGLPSRRNQSLVVGQKVEVEGKSGTYFVELHAVGQNLVRIGISLRNKHLATGG